MIPLHFFWQEPDIMANRRCEPLDDIPLPSKERRNFHPDDALLRECGFVIHARPRTGPALWRLGTEVYTEDEALEAAGGIAEASGRA